MRKDGILPSSQAICLLIARGWKLPTTSAFDVLVPGTALNNAFCDYLQNTMKEKLAGNEELAGKLIPTFSFGCRRITPGTRYLEALGMANVQPVSSAVTEVTEQGCKCADGSEHSVPDVLICATGFDTSYQPRFPIVAGDKDLRDAWAQEPESYLAIAAADMPNFLMMMGPCTPLAMGPVLIALEAQSDYIVKMIDHWQTHNIRSFTPDAAAVRDFIAYRDQFMPKIAYADDCKSWYKSGPTKSRINLWPGSTLHYIETLKQVRFDDWNFEYEGNRFTYLGSGRSQTETDPESDRSFYIREEDDDLPLARNKLTKVINRSGTVARGIASEVLARDSLVANFLAK